MITASAFRSVMPWSWSASRTSFSSFEQFSQVTEYSGVSATGAAGTGDGGLFNVTGSSVICRAWSSLSEAVMLGASKEHAATAMSVDCLSIIIKEGHGVPRDRYG